MTLILLACGWTKDTWKHTEIERARGRCGDVLTKILRREMFQHCGLLLL